MWTISQPSSDEGSGVLIDLRDKKARQILPLFHTSLFLSHEANKSNFNHKCACEPTMVRCASNIPRVREISKKIGQVYEIQEVMGHKSGTIERAIQVHLTPLFDNFEAPKIFQESHYDRSK
jgi:hypothetical protein